MMYGLPRSISRAALCLFFIGMFAFPASAWDGFDSNSGALVEVEPESIPIKGGTITVRVYKLDAPYICVVEDVYRNLRTVEIVVRCSDAQHVVRTLVMDRI